MRFLRRHPRLIALSLFLALAASFVWCITDDIVASTRMAQGDVATPAVSVLSGYLWLIGHGVHGAAIIAVPAFFWPGKVDRSETTGTWEEPGPQAKRAYTTDQ